MASMEKGLNFDIHFNKEDDDHWIAQVRTLKPEPEPDPFEMPLFSQRDPIWAGLQLGNGTSTIGGFGCLITSVAMMVSEVYEEIITPVEVDYELKQNGGYTGENINLMYFAKVWELWPKVKGAGIHTWIKKPAILSKIDEVLDRGGWALTRVDFKPDTPEVDADEHWGLIRGRQGQVYDFVDPWTGTANTLPPVYCKSGWNAARAIFKVALYEPVE